MNKLIIAVTVAALGVGAASAADQTQPPAAPLPAAPHCGAGAGPGDSKGPHKTPVMLDGFGTGGFPVRTSSPEAQRWFDYGMKLAHAFNHEAATDAFVEAGLRDPTCAMCVWGEAWSRGPTINFDVTPDERKRAGELAAKAAVLAEGGPERERLLTDALKVRYDPALGKGADLAFAKAMDELARKYPTDNEIAVLTADAWLIADWNNRRYQNRALTLLGDVLRRDPNDTGAIHFYIHATEFAGVPEYALPFARRLGELAPAAAHLVHMPSHTFIHTGLYQLAADVNAKASDEDKAFIARTGQGLLWKNSYHAHNVTFGLGGAMLAGDGKTALAFADELAEPAKGLEPKDSWRQMSVGTRYFAYGRWAAPDEVLALPDPGSKLAVLHALWRYARGEALARKGNAAGVLAEARDMAPAEADLAALGKARGYAEDEIAIARGVLEGRAALLQGRWGAAADAFRAATAIQDAKLANSWDPPDWWFPVRRSLAEAELKAGRLDAAEADARTVLKTWKDDPIAQTVLADVLTARGRTAEADALRKTAAAGWRGDLKAVRPADV